MSSFARLSGPHTVYDTRVVAGVTAVGVPGDIGMGRSSDNVRTIFLIKQLSADGLIKILVTFSFSLS